MCLEDHFVCPLDYRCPNIFHSHGTPDCADLLPFFLAKTRAQDLGRSDIPFKECSAKFSRLLITKAEAKPYISAVLAYRIDKPSGMSFHTSP